MPVAALNGVQPPVEPEGGIAKHFGLTVAQVEAKESRTDSNRFDTKWQPLDEVKNLVWIKQNTFYSLALEDWDRKVKLITERVDRMEKRIGDLKNEVYQLVGFFSVFQGVVLTAVTQMTQSSNYQSTCKKVWSPVILTGLAWIATILAVWQKLTGIHEIDERRNDEDTSRKEAVNRAQNLRQQGSKFKFCEIREKKDAPTPKQYWITRKFGYSNAFWTRKFGPIVVVLSLFTGIFISSYFLFMCNRGLAPIGA